MTAQQLKNSILQMAVQGKLVPQDPNDEPASVLLERIRAEKEKLIKEGKIKKDKNPSVIFRGEDNLPYEKVGKNEPVCIADEVPFEIPESWEWCRLRDIAIKDIKRGKSPKYTEKSAVFVFAQKCNVKAGGIDISLAKCLDMLVFDKYPEEEYMVDEDIVVNSTGNGTLGRIGIFRDSDRINNNTIVPDSHVTVIRSTREIYSDYVLTVLEYYQPDLEKQGEGSTNQTELKPGVLADLFFPLPPYDEQKRIVESIVSLKGYIEKYKQKENRLSQLNADFPVLLKKSILQQAVMGKLVPQDPNDEPASVLLDKIRSEKETLIKNGKLKKDKHESIIYRRDNSHYEKLDGVERCIDDEIPFEIPQLWQWERFGNIMINKDSERIPLSVDERSKLSKIYDYYGASGVIDKVDNYLFDKPLLLIGEDGANLLNRSTPIAFIATGRYWVNNHAHVLDAPKGILLQYIAFYINSISLAKYVTGTAQPKMNQAKMNSILVAVPPLHEQERIVNKLDCLIPYCDRL